MTEDERIKAREEAIKELARLQGKQPLAYIEQPEQRPLSDKGKTNIISMTFKSSSEDLPHIVTLGPDGIARCTCKAMLSIEYRPTGCWAMVDFRNVVGIHQP